MLFITDTDDVDVVVVSHSQRHQPPLLPFHFSCVWNFTLMSPTNIVNWWLVIGYLQSSSNAVLQKKGHGYGHGA